MSAPCGHPTPSGPCRRPVTTPGAPCGANHTTPTAAAHAASGPPAGTGPGPDPLTTPDGSYGGAGFDQEIRGLADNLTCAVCGEPVEEDDSPGVYTHDRSNPDSYDLDEHHGCSPIVDIDPDQSATVKRWFRNRRPTHPDWDRNAADFPLEYTEWHDEIDTTGDHDAHWADEPDVLDIYADHPNWRVAVGAAANPHTAASTLERLAGHHHPDVRSAAAANPHCPPAARAHTGLLAD